MEKMKRGENVANLTELDESGQYEYYDFEYVPDTYGEFVAELELMGY